MIATHFGCEEFLETAVASILGQSLQDIELWLIDDCSPDERWLTTIKQHRRDSRLRCFRSDRNVGTYRLKNALIARATTPYIAFQDSDDASHSDRLQQQLTMIERGKFNIVGCCLELIDEQGERIGQKNLPRRANWLEKIGKRHLVHHPACLVGRRVFDELGGFDGTTRVGADSDFILRAAQRFRIGNHPRQLYKYRIRPGSLTGAKDTGYGSPIRESYMQKTQERWKQNRKLGKLAELAAPPNDVEFGVSEI